MRQTKNTAGSVTKRSKNDNEESSSKHVSDVAGDVDKLVKNGNTVSLCFQLRRKKGAGQGNKKMAVEVVRVDENGRIFGHTKQNPGKIISIDPRTRLLYVDAPVSCSIY